MEEKIREYLESIDRPSTEACLRLVKIIFACNEFNKYLTKNPEVFNAILDNEEFNNLINTVYEAVLFMEGGEKKNND